MESYFVLCKDIIIKLKNGKMWAIFQSKIKETQNCITEINFLLQNKLNQRHFHQKLMNRKHFFVMFIFHFLKKTKENK